MTALLLALAIGCEVCATLTLKASGGFSRIGPTLVVVVGYAAAFILLSKVLERGMALGVAYAIWAGCGVALVALIGNFLFDEQVGLVTALGIVLIIGGVVVVEVSSHS